MGSSLIPHGIWRKMNFVMSNCSYGFFIWLLHIFLASSLGIMEIKNEFKRGTNNRGYIKQKWIFLFLKGKVDCVILFLFWCVVEWIVVSWFNISVLATGSGGNGIWCVWTSFQRRVHWSDIWAAACAPLYNCWCYWWHCLCSSY